MKLDFGETALEQKERLQQWHTVFALIPHRVEDHDYRWLEYILRRRVYSWSLYHNYTWEYKAIGELNGND